MISEFLPLCAIVTSPTMVSTRSRYFHVLTNVLLIRVYTKVVHKRITHILYAKNWIYIFIKYMHISACKTPLLTIWNKKTLPDFHLLTDFLALLHYLPAISYWSVRCYAATCSKYIYTHKCLHLHPAAPTLFTCHLTSAKNMQAVVKGDEKPSL